MKWMSLLVALAFAALPAAQPEDRGNDAFEKRVSDAKAKLGGTYKEVRVADRKMVLISDLPDKKLEWYVKILGQFQDGLHATLFEHLPDYWLLVLIPGKVEDYQRKLGGRSGAAGFYRPSTKTLTVNIKTGGGTMIHEWTHAMHFADQAGHDQEHPLWVIEGLGSLFEQADLYDGRPIGYTNWRLKGIQGMIKKDQLFPMREFIRNSNKYFRQNSGRAYAQTRYIYYWMQEKRLLREFYREYVKGFKKDKGGLEAFEKVIGKSVSKWQPEWEKFVLGLTFKGLGSTGLPEMGLSLEPVQGGLKVTSVAEKSGAEKAKVKEGDIITKVNGKSVKTLTALHDLLEDHNKGKTVKLKVLRDEATKNLKVKLQ